MKRRMQWRRYVSCFRKEGGKGFDRGGEGWIRVGYGRVVERVLGSSRIYIYIWIEWVRVDEDGSEWVKLG